MAEFVRAKKASFINKPMGVINTATGAGEAFDQLSRLGDQAQQMFYKEAVINQQKAGKDYVDNLKVQARNKKGEFIYAELDKSLSKVATRTAEPLLREKMSNALLVDASKQLTNIRAKSANAKDFETQANNYIEKSMAQLDNTGGGDYSAVYQRLATKTMAQHLNHMVLADAKEAELINTQNALASIEIGKNELSVMLSEGVNTVEGDGGEIYSFEQMVGTLKGKAERLLADGDIKAPKYHDIINNIDKTTMDSIINYKINPMSTNLDVNSLFIMEQAIRTGEVNAKDMAMLSSYDIDQDDINAMRSKRANRDYHSSRVANIRSIVNQRVTALNKGNELKSFSMKLDNKSIYSMKPKHQTMYDKILGNKYMGDGQTITPQWVLQNWETNEDFLSDSLRGSRLPMAVETIFNNAEFISRLNAESPQLAKANLISGIKLFSNIVMQQDTGGNKMYEYGLSTDAHSKWLRLKRLSEQYGDERVTEFATKIFANNEEEAIKNNIRRTNIEDYSGYDSDRPQSPSTFIDSWLYKYTKEQGMNPEASFYLKSVAMHHLAVADTNQSTLKQIIDDTYDNMYVKSSYVWNIGQGSGLTSILPGGMKFSALSTRFAPEKYFGGDKGLLTTFLDNANKTLSLVNKDKKYVIGENAFLFPSRRSTNTNGEYMIVDDSGTPILNKQTGNITQVTTNIVNKKLLERRREEQEVRWDNARRLRKSIEKSKTDAKEALSGSFMENIGTIWSKLGM